MRSIRYILPLLLLFSFHANAGEFPDSILHKSFGRQYPVVYRLFMQYNNYDSAGSLRAIDGLEAWAGDHSDEQLKRLVSVFRFHMYHNRGVKRSFEEEAIQVIKSAESNNWVALKGVVSRYLGYYFANIKTDYSRSLEYYIDAYNILIKLPPTEYIDKADFIYDFAGRYYYFRDYKTAKNYYRQCWETIPLELIPSKVSKMNTLGMCYTYLKEYDSSAICFKKAIAWAEADKDSLWVGIITGNLAANYYELGRYRESVPMFETDIAFSIGGHETGSAARSMAQLASVYHPDGKYQEGFATGGESLHLYHTERAQHRYGHGENFLWLFVGSFCICSPLRPGLPFTGYRDAHEGNFYEIQEPAFTCRGATQN